MNESPGYAAVRNGCGLRPLVDIGILAISGRDRVRFLHGQCTQDVKGKQVPDGGYAFVLDGRGTNVGDFTFTLREDHILCRTAGWMAPKLQSWLSRFVITEDVAIADRTADFEVLQIAGPEARRNLASLFEGELPKAECSGRTGRACGTTAFVVADRSLGEEGFLVFLDSNAAPSASGSVATALIAQGATIIDPADAHILRVEAGLPLWGPDIQADTLPIESGQEARVVSYTKGCFAGQEVVAKQRTAGKPRRKLVGVISGKYPLRFDDAVCMDGEIAGTVRSPAWSPKLGGWIALAVVRGDASSAVRFGLARAPGSGAFLERVDLPFATGA